MYELKIGDTFNEVFPFILISSGVPVADFTGWTVNCMFTNTSTGIDSYSCGVSINSNSTPAFVSAIADTHTWTPGVYTFDFRFRNFGGTIVVTSQTFTLALTTPVTS